MVKKCKVLSYNPHLNIVVVDFDGKEIQFTGVIDKGAEEIYVKYENGLASVTSKPNKSFENKAKEDKKSNKTDWKSHNSKGDNKRFGYGEKAKDEK